MIAYHLAGLALVALAALIVLPGVVAIVGAAAGDWLSNRRWKR